LTPDLLYKIALTCIPNIGPVQAKILLQVYEPEEIFQAKRTDLEKIEGIGSIRAKSIKQFDKFRIAEEEMRFIEKFRIKPLFIGEEDYPLRLLNCYDSPTLLYYKGEANLNSSKIVSVIGTRNHTEYGKLMTEKFISDLAPLNVLIISGLAFGIDALAHKAALRNNLATVGILAHGLDQVYPHEHRSLAKELTRNSGGLLTEFLSGTKPDRHNFPTRNRIVAGLSDATVVIETGVSGGSMITAELANGYNRDVFAFPGKVTDSKSAGCNQLIRNHKAILITNGTELAELLRWQPKENVPKEKQRRLFVELTDNEKRVLQLLQEREMMHIDELNLRSGLSSSAVAAAVLSLELQNVIVALPGKVYGCQ